MEYFPISGGGQIECRCGCGELTALVDAKGRPRQGFIHGHNTARGARDRFWAKVKKDGPGGCWLWTDAPASNGYGYVQTGRGEDRKRVLAHRFAYELVVGPIPAGLTIDHLCRVRHCVNPEHLEPVTRRENSLRGISPPARNARKTHCVHGHPFDAENMTVRRNGWRRCRSCQTESRQRARQR